MGETVRSLFYMKRGRLYGYSFWYSLSIFLKKPIVDNPTIQTRMPVGIRTR